MWWYRIHGNSDREPCSDHRLTVDKQLQHGTIYIQPNRHDTCRHDLCMVITDSSSRRNRRGIRHRPEHGERYTDEHDSRSTDSDLQRNTYIRYMYRLSLYSNSDSQSECHDHGSEHDQLYDRTVHIQPNRHDTCRHDVCMEQPDRCKHHRGSYRHRPEHGERHTDEHNSKCSDSSIQRNTDIRYMYRSDLHGKCSDQPCSDDSLTVDKQLQHGTIYIQPNRHDTCRHDVCMEFTGHRCRHQWRVIRHRQHVDSDADQQFSKCRDSDLQCNTDIGQLHDRQRIHGNSDREPCSDHRLTGNKQLYDRTIHIQPNRHDTSRHDLCMVITDSSSRRNRRVIRHRPEHTERYTDEHNSRSTDSDLQRNTDIRYMYLSLIHISEPTRPY